MASVEFDQAWEHAMEKGFREGRQRRRNERFDQAREKNKRLQNVVANLPPPPTAPPPTAPPIAGQPPTAPTLSVENTLRRRPVRRRAVSTPPPPTPTEPKFQGTTFEPMSSLSNAFETLGVTGEEPMGQEEASAILGGEVPYNLQGERIPPRPAPTPMKDERARPMPTSGPSLQERMNRFFRDYDDNQATPSPTDVSTEKVEQMIDMSDGVNDPTNDEMGSAKTPSPESDFSEFAPEQQEALNNFEQRVDATDFTAMPDYETDEEPSSFMALPEPEEEPLSDEAGEAGWKAIEESIRPPEPKPEPPKPEPPKPEPKPASQVPAVQEAVAPMKETKENKMEWEPVSMAEKDSIKYGTVMEPGKGAVGSVLHSEAKERGLTRIKAGGKPAYMRMDSAPKKAAPKKAAPKKAAPKKKEEKSPTDDLPKSKKSPKEAKEIAANIGDDKKPKKDTSMRNMPIGEPPAETEEEQFEREPPAHKEERERLEGNKKSGNPAQGAVAAALEGNAKPKKPKKEETKVEIPIKAPKKNSPLGHNIAKKGYPINKALSVKDLLALGLMDEKGLFLTNRDGLPAAGTAISPDHVQAMTIAPQSVSDSDLRGTIGIPMNLSPLIAMSKNRQGPSSFAIGSGGERAYVGQGKEPFPPLTATVGDDVFTGTGFSGDEFPMKDLQDSAKRQGLGRYRKGAKRVVTPKIPSLIDGVGFPKLRSFDAPQFILDGTNRTTLDPQLALMAEVEGQMRPVARRGEGEAVWEIPFMNGKGQFMVNSNIFDSYGTTGKTVAWADEMGKPTGTRGSIPVMMPPVLDNMKSISIETSIKELMERLKNAPKAKEQELISFEEAPKNLFSNEMLRQVLPKLKDFKDNPANLDLLQVAENSAGPLRLRAETTEHLEEPGDFDGLMNELRYLLAPRIESDDNTEPFVI